MRAATLVLVACVVAAGIGFLVADAEGDTFTGCLYTSGKSKGSMVKVAPGMSPLSACSSKNQVEITWASDPPAGSSGEPGQDGTDGPDGRPGDQGPPGPLNLEGEECLVGDAIRGFDSDGGLICEHP